MSCECQISKKLFRKKIKNILKKFCDYVPWWSPIDRKRHLIQTSLVQLVCFKWDMFYNFNLVKIHQIPNNSTTFEAREKYT